MCRINRRVQGVGSSEEGELQFLLDRRLNQDDGRGMGETVVDSVDVEVSHVAQGAVAIL